MEIQCDNCSQVFQRKPSEVNKDKNYCSVNCSNTYKKSLISEDDRIIRKFIKSKWVAMNIRCGKYRSDLYLKNKSYKDVNVDVSREEFKDFCFKNKNKILSLKKPSIDRIDSDKGYTLSNMDIIELEENIIKRKRSNRYIANFFGIKRGVRKLKNGKFSARITMNKKEVYLGVFDSEELAYEVFRDKYYEHYNKYPW